MKFLTAVALAAVMLWVPVDGVAQDRTNPLTGLSTMDHVVFVSWDDEIGSSEQRFTQEAERALELGLLRTGITLDDKRVPYLECSMNLLSSIEGNLVIYSRQVGYREFVVPFEDAISAIAASSAIDLNPQVAETWGTSLVGSVGISNLSGTDAGEWCAEAFELAWRRANN